MEVDRATIDSPPGRRYTRAPGCESLRGQDGGARPLSNSRPCRAQFPTASSGVAQDVILHYIEKEPNSKVRGYFRMDAEDKGWDWA